tara:strand:- start:684 stop:986 length:303 start_codon:yes stop_codon:yes gene_type:complete
MSNHLENLPNELLIKIYLFLGSKNIKNLKLFNKVENSIIEILKNKVLFESDLEYTIVIQPTYKISIVDNNLINNLIKYYFLNLSNNKSNIWSNNFLIELL